MKPCAHLTVRRSVSFILCLFACAFVLFTVPAAANPVPVGACCFPGGQCELLDEDICLAQGGFFGPYWDCDPNPCAAASGSCCHLDGLCVVLSLPDCIEQEHGLWIGPGYACDPNPCPNCLTRCVGVCCFSDGHCEPMYESTCIMLSGSFLAVAGCNPNPCGTADASAPSDPRQRNERWGALKRQYR